MNEFSFKTEMFAGKKEPDKICPAWFQMNGNVYGAFVLGGVAGAAFVLGAGAGVLLSDGLQPVNIALTAIPNSTTMDSFFIGRRNLYWFTTKHKKIFTPYL